MKTKFNPKDVPSWCKWIAVDKDGDAYGFKNKPVILIKSNLWALALKEGGLSKFKKLYKDKPPKNWKEELYTWGY